MKKIISLLFVILLVSLSACDTTLAVLQGLSNGVNDYNSTNSYNQTVTPSSYPTNTSSYSEKEWHDCSVCQGSGKRAAILKDAAILAEELIDTECRNCPIRWSCINCMAMNYQHFGDFGKNINKLYSCSAHKITAYWSASLLASSAMKNQVDLSDDKKLDAVRKAIDYIKVFEYGK